MKKNIAISLVIITALALNACAVFRSGGASAPGAPVRSMPSTVDSAAYESKGGGEYVSNDMATIPNPVERIVIKNASLSIAVEDPVAGMQAITRMAEGMNGYVVSSNVYKTYTSDNVEVPVADITVRIPSEQLEEAMKQVKALVPDAETDILTENVSGQDVTSEYTDTESRLNNLLSAETQLVKIMEAAEKTEDVMSVFRELTSVREQIEVLQGQLNYYNEAARLSALSVNLQAKEALKPITVAGWQPGLELQKALQALLNALMVLVNVLIFAIIVLVPIFLIIGLPIYLILKAIRKRRMAVKPEETKIASVKK